MHGMNEINKIVWLKDTEDLTIFLIVEKNSFKQFFLSTKNNQIKKITLENSELNIDGSIITKNKENEFQNFFSRIDRILKKKSFFSLTYMSEDKKYRKKLLKYKQSDEDIERFQKLLTKNNVDSTFKKEHFYQSYKFNQVYLRYLKDNIEEYKKYKEGLYIVPLDIDVFKKNLQNPLELITKTLEKDGKNKTNSIGFNFKDIKEMCETLIKKISKNKKNILIRSNNDSLGYIYEVEINNIMVLLKKIDPLSTKIFELNFENNTLFINENESNESYKLFITYFKQVISDLKKNKANLENVELSEN